MTSSVLRLVAISFLIVLAGWWLWPDQPVPETASSAGALQSSSRNHAPAPVWELADRDPGIKPSASGLDELPPELVRPISPVRRPVDADLSLDLGHGGLVRLSVISRQVHANGDRTLVGRSPTESAVLTWGEAGLFGRIHTDNGLYLVHSDASGSWLVDMNDERLDVDSFDHDTLIPDFRDPASRPEPVAAQAGAAMFDVAASAASELSVIDVMFVYTPDMLERYPGGLIETRLNHLVAIANQTMVDSDVPISVRLVNHESVNYTRSRNNFEALDDLNRALSGENIAGLSGLDTRRSQVGADIVAFTWPHDIETRGSCGLAYFPRPEGSAFDPAFGVHIDVDGVSNWSICSDAVFTHELGHNLNAQHQRSQAGGDPSLTNYAFIQDDRFHTIMGSFGTGDRNRYLRLDVFSNPRIDCGGQPCGLEGANIGTDNAAEISALAPFVASYASTQVQSDFERPDPSDLDSDDDGVTDWQDPFPFDPLDGQPDPNPSAELVFSDRVLTASSDPQLQELLVVSSGSDQVLAFDIDGSFRSVAVAPERVDPGPVLTEYSDLIADDMGRLYLLSSGDVRRYDRLSGRLIDVFLGSRRPQPNDLLSAFPRAIARLPNNQFVVLGDGAIERYSADRGNRLTQLQGAEPTQDPGNWNERLDLALRSAVQRSLRLYVAEATGNRILVFSAATGTRMADLAGPDNGVISDPWGMTFDNNGLLYLANGSANNVLRFDPTDNRFVDEFVSAGSGGLDFARAVRFGPDGHLYVASRNSHEILRYDGVSGDFLGVAVTAGSAGLAHPEQLVFSGMINQTDPGFSGLFFDPARSGEGWMVEMLDANSATLSWFTYPPQSSTDQQAWLVSVGSVDGSRLVFDGVLRANGSGFGADFDPASLELESWGALTLDFHDCDQGTVSYQGPEDWGSGEIAFQRLIAIPGLPCGSESLSPDSGRPGVSGQWFDPELNGQGWYIQETAPGQIFTAWYAHDDQGHQTWLVGSGSYANGIAQFDNLQLPVGTEFGPGFDPDDVDRQDWGTLTITFTDCNSAVAEYHSELPGFGNGIVYPERLTKLDQLECQVP